MLGVRSLKSIYPIKIKVMLTKECIKKYLELVKILEENYFRTDTFS